MIFLKKVGELPVVVESGNHMRVLNGGSLLHNIPWTKDESFIDIAKRYVAYVCKCYVKVAVVFDGYVAGSTTKDAAHERRFAGIIVPAVHFHENTRSSLKKEIVFQILTISRSSSVYYQVFCVRLVFLFSTPKEMQMLYL